MIGTRLFSAIFFRSLCFINRAIIQSTFLDMYWVSSPMSARARFVALQSRNMACPPSCVMATSKDTRVLVEVFWKIIANDLSFNAVRYFSWFFLISIALSITSFICCDVQSLRVSRCIFVEPRMVFLGSVAGFYRALLYIVVKFYEFAMFLYVL